MTSWHWGTSGYPLKENNASITFRGVILDCRISTKKVVSELFFCFILKKKKERKTVSDLEP